MIVWKEVDWIQFAWNGKKNCISSRMADSFLFADVAFVIHWQLCSRCAACAPFRAECSLSNGVAVAGSATLHLANSELSAHGVWQHLARGAVAFPFVEEPEAHRLRQVKHPADARTAICILDCGVDGKIIWILIVSKDNFFPQLLYLELVRSAYADEKRIKYLLTYFMLQEKKLQLSLMRKETRLK